jgi:hypothetical protein
MAWKAKFSAMLTRTATSFHLQTYQCPKSFMLPISDVWQIFVESNTIAFRVAMPENFCVVVAMRFGTAASTVKKLTTRPTHVFARLWEDEGLSRRLY